MNSIARVAGPLRRWAYAPKLSQSRRLHQTPSRNAISNLQMPAMSPTMTEGGIASWKKQEGDKFIAGDVLLEIETDKATIDVEAQDDGVLGKIITPDGSKNVAVGKIIALLAEEGDDISNLEVPKEEQKPAPPKSEQTASPPKSQSSPPPSAQSQPQLQSTQSSSHPVSEPTHASPLFPSVHRLLLENASSIPNAADIKGTGIRGMLTKGDVLAFLGRASGPLGSYEGKGIKGEMNTAKTEGAKTETAKPLDGPALRRLIVMNLSQLSLKARNAAVAAAPATFDSIIADYLPTPPASGSALKPKAAAVPPTKKNTTDAYFDGLI
ncbi:hypothetical protein PILCRDRAFT_815003 [Piloderma croceum F 1598]|uniref:Single hybrid motif-containing protein n=1 Tax=Piloderma croceum (strain F 1598) TaxID=765440 RepID=A0A0C3G6P3_PILCF|nr:hypothetical protein PILCRDRAFT_815003 [Piloderma croceum F 1598]